MDYDPPRYNWTNRWVLSLMSISYVLMLRFKFIAFGFLSPPLNFIYFQVHCCLPQLSIPKSYNHIWAFQHLCSRLKVKPCALILFPMFYIHLEFSGQTHGLNIFVLVFPIFKLLLRFSKDFQCHFVIISLLVKVSHKSMYITSKLANHVLTNVCQMTIFG